MDTAALLGGNEFLLEESLHEIQNVDYNDNQTKVLRWALTEVQIVHYIYIYIYIYNTMYSSYYYILLITKFINFSFGVLGQQKKCLTTQVHPRLRKMIMLKLNLGFHVTRDV